MTNKIERFTYRARSALMISQIYVEYWNHSSIDIHHVSLSIWQLKSSIGGRMLRSAGITFPDLYYWISTYNSPPPKDGEKLELSSSVKRMLELSVDEARRAGHHYIGTEHMALGLLQIQPFVEFLLSLKVDPIGTRTRFINIVRTPQFAAKPDKNRNILSRVIGQFLKTTDVEFTAYFRLVERKIRVNVGAAACPARKQVNLLENRYSKGESHESAPPEDNFITMILDDLGDAIQNMPDNTGLYNHRAELYAQVKNYDAALTDYTQVIRLKPDKATAYLNRALIRHRQKDYANALSDLNETIRLAPENLNAVLQRGYTYWANKEYDKALVDLERVIQENPKCAAAYSGRANVYFNNAEPDKSLADCEEALRLDPQNINALHLRGTIRADQNDLVKAGADFQKIYQLCPTSTYAHSNLGWLALLKGQYQNAIKHCNDALQIDPENGLAYYSRGTAHAAIGDHKLAVADYKLSLQYWTMINSKHSAHYGDEMRAYIEHWENQP